MNIKPQYFGIAEQIVLSASNMLASLVVVGVADMRWFGIYSFIFILATFASAFFSTLLHRQMILRIASSNFAERRRVFLATLVIQAVTLLLLAVLLVLFFNFFSDSELIRNYKMELVAAACFVALYNMFDLCRQYLYVLDGQAYAFRCTVVYAVVLLPGFFWIHLQLGAGQVVASIYGLFCVALLISLASNRRCQQEYLEAQWMGWSYVKQVLFEFFNQGKFRIVGMLITWLQNQSMNPFLMWVSGPLVAGYFSMARLLVMPMAVVNQGLTNSTTPQLRRLFQSYGSQRLKEGVSRYNRINLGLSCVYLAILCLAHIIGLMERFVPSYDNVRWFLLIWVVTLMVTMYRYWLGQIFVVRMQFRFLMQVSIAALLVSMGGMVGIGYFLDNIYLALAFVVVGELITIILFFLYAERLSIPEIMEKPSVS